MNASLLGFSKLKLFRLFQDLSPFTLCFDDFLFPFGCFFKFNKSFVAVFFLFNNGGFIVGLFLQCFTHVQNIYCKGLLIDFCVIDQCTAFS